MAQISVSCSNSRGILVDRQTTQVEDLLAACDYCRYVAKASGCELVILTIGGNVTGAWRETCS